MRLLSSTKTQSWLAWFLRGLLILGFLVLVSRLTELQIIKGSYYQKLAEENRIKIVRIPAPRGRILARGGEALIGPDFAHITGFVGEADPDEVGKVDPNCLEKGPKILGQLVGKSGLQDKYNCQLTGVDGQEMVEVDTLGNSVRTLATKKPVGGSDLPTTIDYGMQKEVVKEMDKKGAVIITDAKGEVLALYSYPSYDPDNVVNYLKDPDLPFFNRAIGGNYHPGSTFKPLVAIAALMEGKIDKNFTYEDTGKIEIKTLYGDFSYSNWYLTQYGRTEGVINLVKALARSTDTFFYTIGEMVGPEAIADWSDRFGLTRPTGIDLPGEIGGLVPTPEWKKRVKNENWFLGNTYHLAIGQGDIAVTPLELNMMTAGVATGEICEPKIYSAKKENCRNLDITKENLDLVREGMKEVCTTGGTGYTFFDWNEKRDRKVSCKTGTAEVGVDGDTHAWFTLFYPSDNPEIVATVLVEKGGEGSRVAGPIARKIMDYANLRENP